MQPQIAQVDNNCTLSTCPVALAEVEYDPSLGGNAFYLAIFAILLLVQIFLGVIYRTWGFLAGLVGGLVLEVVGYAGRIQLHFNPFHKNPFVIYLVCLTIGPIFLSGAIYLCLARIIVAYGAHLSRFQPRVYTIGFICCDLLSLALQAAGGGITSYATTGEKHKHGVNIMVTGLSLQVFSLVVFIVCCGDFALRISRAGKGSLNLKHAALRHSSNFRSFLYGLSVATFCILIRSCFRVAELSHGFGSKLANQQVTFMILEGAMIVIASVTLTALHPGVAFQGSWAEADFTVWGAHKHGAVDEGDADGTANEAGEAETVVVQIMEK